MSRNELRHRILTALGIGAAGAVSLGSGPCGDCFHPQDTFCFEPDDYRRWVDSLSDARSPEAGAGGANGEGECPSVEEVGPYAKTQSRSYEDVTWKKLEDGGISAADSGTQCCYSGISSDWDCPGGRPFLVDGSPREALLLTADDGDVTAGGTFARSALHEALAAAWLRSALVEHASVAAFARLSLELMALGAPLELVAGAHRAALDEVRHFELCLARAHDFTNRRFRPGALDVSRCLDVVSLAELVRLDVAEGCIGETVAAVVMAEQAERARDPELARELGRIAEDEGRHAALAWRIAAWTIAQGGPPIRYVIHDTLAAWRPPAFDESKPLTPIEIEMATLGHLDRRSYALACRSTFSEVVLPLAFELVGTSKLRRRGPAPRPSETTLHSA